MIRKALIIPFIAISIAGFAQNDQSEYLEAKRLFSQGQYTSAKAAFGTLSDSDIFGKYAGFYFGLSAYHAGDTTVALDMWRQLLLNFPQWDQKPELLFWLSYVNFQQGNFNQGLSFASQLTEETVNIETENAMISKFIWPLEVEKIRQIYRRNEENRLLASILVRKMNALPYEERDAQAIDQLIEKWNFGLEEIESVNLPVVRKKEYEIGVFLPFLFESLRNTNVIVQNALVMDMYQGMLLAAEDLEQRGRPVNLWPYDTKKNKDVTKRILQQDEVKSLDLIVGPLYPGPNDVINEFSLKHLINTINPISSNGEVIGGNPLSFLSRPSYETMALKMAELAIQESDSNKYAMIFYEENERDSTFAALFKQKIEAEGFEVVWYQSLNKENSKAVLDVLGKQYDVYLTEEEADSIQLLPGRFVRSRRIRTDELRRIEREQKNDLISSDEKFTLPVSYDDRENEIVYYEKKYTIRPDSIGFILGATKSNLFANNLISAVETRSDSIRLYGYGDWLDFTMLSYDQLSRLGIALTNPDFIDKNKYTVEVLKTRFQNRFKTKPSLNHFRGYELLWYVGNMLHEHGRYFQKGIKGGAFQKGRIFEGFRYESGNDNQVVPIVRFRGAVLEVVNKSNYEDREK